MIAWLDRFHIRPGSVANSKSMRFNETVVNDCTDYPLQVDVACSFFLCSHEP